MMFASIQGDVTSNLEVSYASLSLSLSLGLPVLVGCSEDSPTSVGEIPPTSPQQYIQSSDTVYVVDLGESPIHEHEGEVSSFGPCDPEKDPLCELREPTADEYKQFRNWEEEMRAQGCPGIADKWGDMYTHGRVMMWDNPIARQDSTGTVRVLQGDYHGDVGRIDLWSRTHMNPAALAAHETAHAGGADEAGAELAESACAV